MKMLAIETSSVACSVALKTETDILTSHVIAPMQQTKLILPMIQKILKDANYTLHDLNAIAFGCGPGSFTGVRIATSVAQGLAFGAELPLIAISSLAALAQTAYQQMGWQNVLVGIDARMQEIYWGAFKANNIGSMQLIGRESLCKPNNIVIPDSASDWNAAGDAWTAYAISYQPLNINSQILPTALGVLHLAQHSPRHINPQAALPSYLRNDVAKKAI